ncbi:MAG: hypothetical protein ACI80V_003609 [Rhodothermales bacterium]|jgi:hypothetical protein
MSVKPLFIVLVDISGYTTFIRLHKISLLHAERIIGELMECMLDEVEAPVVAHEILGDAISLYAVDDGSPGLADSIYQQLEQYFLAFRKREAYLLRECGYCICEACNQVGQLKLKAILHWGSAAFTKIRDMPKVSGIDVITAHRLLKNSIASDEYILVTDSFSDKCQSFDRTGFNSHVEHCDGVGPVSAQVRDFESVETDPEVVSPWRKFKFLMKLEGHMFARLLGKARPEFRNLPPEA